MNQLELKNKIAALLPGWHVTVDEADMVNVQADGHTGPFCYIEEYDTVTDSAAGYGLRRTRREEIYFCRLTEFQNDGEQRVRIREEELRPACDKVEGMLARELGAKIFTTDPMPRGFDANEVLLHLVVEWTEQVC